MDTTANQHCDSFRKSVPEPAAQNDESFGQSDCCPAGLASSVLVENAFRLMTDAPLDMPARQDAIMGLAASLKALEPELPDVALLCSEISELVSSANTSAADSAVVASLSRRKGRFLIYALAREIGSAVKNKRVLDIDLLKIVGIHCIRHLLTGDQPSALSIANLRHGLLFSDSKKSQSWSRSARARAMNKARQGLTEALENNQKCAAEYGLSATLTRPEQSLSPIEEFNRSFRRRVENLIDFATLDAVAAAGGYDTLSKAGLLFAGQQILNKVLAGDRGAVVVGLEILTHLPSDCVLQIPIQRGELPPEGALAWLDLDRGYYCQVLYRVLERGAKVDSGKEHLYEETTQVVSVKLSPPFHQSLIEMDHLSDGAAANVKGLAGPSGHHPRSAVVEGAGYRITARRMQESVPTLLLQEGCQRWPVALATNSHFLVTRGRRAYGACRSESICEVTKRGYDLLGWPKPTGPFKSDLVGTPTVPKDESVTQGLNFLCARADQWSVKLDSYASVCMALSAHAEWLAMLEALAFALRRWNVYQIRLKQITNVELVSFNDKDIHEHQGPGVPAVSIMRDAAKAWITLCRDTSKLLSVFADPESAALSHRLENYLADETSDIGIVTVDALGNLKPVGQRTWCEALPDNIRLKPNFARQYWPMKLMDMGVEQSVIDLLMRHQLDSLPPGTTRSLKILNRSMETLKSAMEDVVADLKLCVPSKLQGSHHGR